MITNFLKKNEVIKLFTVFFDQGMASLTTFLITVLLANNFDKNEYADFILLSSISMTILGFQRAIITQSFAINYNDYNERDKKDYFKFNFSLKILFNILLLIIFPFYLIFSDDYNNSLIFNCIIIFYIICFTSYYFVKDILIGSRQTKFAFKVGCVTNALILIILFTSYWFKRITFNEFLFSLGAMYLIGFIFYYFSSNIDFKIKINNSFLQNNWKVGRWILGSNLFYSLFAQTTPWLILYLLSKEDVAIYGVLISATSLINPVMKSMSLYLLPLFTSYRNDLNVFRNKFKKWFYAFSAISVLLLILGLLAGEWMVAFVFGEKYFDLGWIVVLPFFNQAINILFQPVDIAMNALKRTDLGFYLLVLRTFISLILAFIFISNFGLLGVFIARIIENILYQLVLFFKTSKLMTI